MREDIPQIPAVHEFGHLLGLDHDGVPGEYDGNGLMASGMEYRALYFRKWMDWMDSRFPVWRPFAITNGVVRDLFEELRK